MKLMFVGSEGICITKRLKIIRKFSGFHIETLGQILAPMQLYIGS